MNNFEKISLRLLILLALLSAFLGLSLGALTKEKMDVKGGMIGDLNIVDFGKIVSLDSCFYDLRHKSIRSIASEKPCTITLEREVGEYNYINNSVIEGNTVEKIRYGDTEMGAEELLIKAIELCQTNNVKEVEVGDLIINCEDY